MSKGRSPATVEKKARHPDLDYNRRTNPRPGNDRNGYMTSGPDYDQLADAIRVAAIAAHKACDDEALGSISRAETLLANSHSPESREVRIGRGA